jgi:Neuraminidase (sialidase)
MNSLQLVIESGASLVTSEATVMMQYSDDNGRTWSSERWANIGEQGDYTYKLEWLGLGSFYNRMFRFSMSDPIKWVLISASADVEMGLG